MKDNLFFGKIENKKIVISDRSKHDFAKYMLENEGQEIIINITKFRKTRSILQNSYYWGVILKILADFTGHSKEEIHEAMKLKFLSYDDCNIKFIRSTRTLTTAEAEEYYENIRRWAATELGVFIPDPDPEFNNKATNNTGSL